MSVNTVSSERLYLKVEAVNIYATILDTSQLSVIRGSSNIIKNAIEELSTTPNGIEGQLEPITTGGSIGIFKVENAIDQDKLICTVREFLTSSVGGLGKYFTFVVNTVVARSYLEAKEALVALGRHSQLNQLSVPAPYSIDSPKGICAYNGFLPTSQKSQLPNTPSEKASESVNQRFHKGRNLRTSIYFEGNDAFSDQAKYKLSQDLQQLAGTHHTLSLDGKIAVIYADGNGFGAIQREAINNSDSQKGLKNEKGLSQQENAQRNYDNQLKTIRQNYQKSLIDLFVARQPGLKGNEENTPIQVETLLWGGDESTIVVPAWLGFEVLQHFFDHHKNEKLNNQPITFSAGMVLCTAKTPIQKAQKLAVELADNIKEQPNGRKHNMFDYAVLESIDYFVENSLKEFWVKQFHAQGQKRRPLAYQEKAALNETLQSAIEALPRHRIYYLVKTFLSLPIERLAIQQDLTPEKTKKHKTLAQEELEREQNEGKVEYLHRTQLVNNIYTDLVNGLNAENKDILEKLGSIFQYLPIQENQKELACLTHESPYFWIHLLELYDYLVPDSPKRTQTQSEEQ